MSFVKLRGTSGVCDEIGVIFGNSCEYFCEFLEFLFSIVNGFGNAASEAAFKGLIYVTRSPMEFASDNYPLSMTFRTDESQNKRVP